MSHTEAELAEIKDLNQQMAKSVQGIRSNSFIGVRHGVSKGVEDGLWHRPPILLAGHPLNGHKGVEGPRAWRARVKL
jgi:hypothetical protein